MDGRVEQDINDLLHEGGIGAGNAAVVARSRATGASEEGQFEALAQIVKVQSEAIRRLAREVDELRSAVNGGPNER